MVYKGREQLFLARFMHTSLTPSSHERVILVSVAVTSLESINAEEFALLATSAGAEIVQHLDVQRHHVDAKYFIGSGKVEEIRTLVEQEQVSLVIFDHALTPAQERNLERAIQCRVMDRTGLILDIFAQRARTHEGKIQVELAQLDYISSRLVRGYSNLSSQKGGIGLKGPGETQLETDRRLLRVRVNQLKAKLEKIQHTRQQGRMARQKATIPTVSLVGYTNAGKSTLFNALAKSDVYSADQLFATLDPTLRRVQWTGIGTVVLADTVGFVRHLHHSLVESFKATLEETKQATLLLHVIDSHSPEMLEQIDAVEQVLQEIGADVPILRVYNKIDQSHEPEKIIYNQENIPQRVYVSAQTGQGLDLLQDAIRQRLLGHNQRFKLTLQPQHAKLRASLYALNVIQQEQYQDDGRMILDVEMSPAKLLKMIQQHHYSVDELLGEQAQALKTPLEPFEQNTT